jgi:hypothetical protein
MVAGRAARDVISSRTTVRAERKHPAMSQSPSPSPIHAAVTRARIERVIARLPEVSEDRLDGIEATLFEIGNLRATCSGCGELYRPYIERCGTCRRA